jgi:hypothetical protein
MSFENITFFIKYGAVINNISRSYVRENQNDVDSSITLRGRFFNSRQICTLRNSTGYVQETALLQFVDEQTVRCNIYGFFKAEVETHVDLSLKEYDSQNASIVYESNRMPLIFLP